MLPFPALGLDPAQEAIEERHVERAEHQRESYVVEGQAPEGDERHHQHGRKGRERNVPAALLEDPVVVVGRLRNGERELAVKERVSLVDEVRSQRLVREHAAAGDGVRSQGAEKERQLDAVSGHGLAPAHAQEVPCP